MKKVEKYGVFEVGLQGPSDGNPFTDVILSADFFCGGRKVPACGFYDGAGQYKLRFMPDKQGEWSYRTISNIAGLDGITGEFLCTPAKSGSHGPVRVANTFHFAYDDGTPFFPFGTTCYAWTNQENGLIEKTLKTLKTSPFNKVRMCVFPKYYDYNTDEPPLYPYGGSLKDGFDFTRFNPAFFENFERQIESLCALGIEADVILFHPYDKWGFSKMSRRENLLYLKYAAARFSCYRNVWWSMANEYDLMEIPENDWDEFGKALKSWDSASHLISVHNCLKPYDFRAPWITHCSLQRTDTYVSTEKTDELRSKYNKPVVFDEVCYEGDIQYGWGNITPEEMTRRFWEATIRGGYCTHGETYLNENEILWWSKGGSLCGESPARIAFLKNIVERAPAGGLAPCRLKGMADWDLPACVPENEADSPVPGFILCYFGFERPRFRIFSLPDADYDASIIDTWNMEITKLPGTFRGRVRIDLPARQYIAVRFQKAAEVVKP